MTEERYHLTARLMHWIMALGFVFMWACGYAMTSLVEDDSPLEELLFDLHISVGVTLLALLVLRIAIRLVHRPPPLIRGVERKAALSATRALVWSSRPAGRAFGGLQWFGVELPTSSARPLRPLRGRAHVARRWPRARCIDGHDLHISVLPGVTLLALLGAARSKPFTLAAATPPGSPAAAPCRRRWRPGHGAQGRASRPDARSGLRAAPRLDRGNRGVRPPPSQAETNFGGHMPFRASQCRRPIALRAEELCAAGRR